MNTLSEVLLNKVKKTLYRMETFHDIFSSRPIIVLFEHIPADLDGMILRRPMDSSTH